MKLPNKTKDIPEMMGTSYKRVSSFYADIIIDIIKENGNNGLSRIDLEKLMSERLKNMGFEWDEYISKHKNHCEDCTQRTCKTIYLKIHSALQELRDEGRVSTVRYGSSVVYYLNKKQVSKMKTETKKKKNVVSTFSTTKSKKKKKNVVNMSLTSAVTSPKKLAVTDDLMNSNDIIEASSRGLFKVSSDEVKNHYITTSYSHVEIIISMGFDILTKGKPGVEKTRDLLYYAHKHDLDCFHITFTEDMASWNLIGRSILTMTYDDISNFANHNNIPMVDAAQKMFFDTWSYGILAQACKNAQAGNKTIVIIDEINLASPLLTAGILNMALNNNKLVIQDTGEIITWKKSDLIFAATMNPDIVDIELNEALDSRFVKYEYDDPDYKKIVESLLGQKPSLNMCKLYDSLNASNLSKTIGLREIIFWSQLELKLAPLARDENNKYHPLLIKLI